MTNPTREDIWAGRRRLAQLLPEAQRRVAAHAMESKGGSAVGNAMAPHCTADNINAVLILRGDLGGWCCDVMLKRVPPGVANSFGTPVAAPFPTREQAEAAAVDMLTIALTMGADAAAKPPPPTVVDYFGIDVTLPPDLLATMERMPNTPAYRYGSRAVANERLDEVTEQLFPGSRPTLAGVRALRDKQQALLLARLAMAALEGVFRYPEARAEPPGKHSPVEYAESE